MELYPLFLSPLPLPIQLSNSAVLLPEFLWDLYFHPHGSPSTGCHLLFLGLDYHNHGLTGFPSISLATPFNSIFCQQPESSPKIQNLNHVKTPSNLLLSLGRRSNALILSAILFMIWACLLPQPLHLESLFLDYAFLSHLGLYGYLYLAPPAFNLANSYLFTSMGPFRLNHIF